MVWYWISFGLLALAFLAGPILLRNLALKNPQVEITKDIKKRANFTMIKLIIFYEVCDLFYMSCFINSLAWKYIFGCIILVVIFVNLATAFSFPKDKRTGLDKYGMVQDFLVGIGLTIYLIYIIPDTSVQEIVIPMVAAVYGGLITLVGVSWTIKKSDKDRKEDETKKSRPIFSYNILRKEPTFGDVIQKICLSDTLEKGAYSCEAIVELENSNLSMFEIKRVYHDHTWVGFEGNKVVLPGAKCLLTFVFSDSPDKLVLEIEDILNNKYYYQLKALFLNAKSSSGKMLHTIREINQLTINEVKELTKKK